MTTPELFLSRSLQKPGRKIRRRLPQKLRELVWTRYNGEEQFLCSCFCCGDTKITPFSFEAGHVVAHSLGGKDELSNLRPICTQCNGSCGNEHMFSFARRLGFESRAAEEFSDLNAIYELIIHVKDHVKGH